MSNFAGSIKEAVMRGEQFYQKLCTVDSVNRSSRMICCTPVDGSAQLLNVRLQSVGGASNGLCIIPTAKSTVLVGFLDKNNAEVLITSSIEEIRLDVNDNIIINGGDNKGLVKVKELTDKLNALKDTVNNLVNAYNAHIHTGTSATGGPVTTIAPVTTAQPAETFSVEDYSNDKIKH
jgi:hypothetical protein